jgi:hypothetical protein
MNKIVLIHNSAGVSEAPVNRFEYKWDKAITIHPSPLCFSASTTSVYAHKI